MKIFSTFLGFCWKDSLTLYVRAPLTVVLPETGKYLRAIFHENPCSRCGVICYKWTDGQTDRKRELDWLSAGI
jgi:hypothetical protein